MTISPKTAERGVSMQWMVVLSSVISSLVTVVVLLATQQVLSPGKANAQTTLGVVQASEFNLVGPDGTVVGRWEVRPSRQEERGDSTVDIRGGGRLSIFDNDGKLHASVAPEGLFIAYGEDGAPR